MDKVQSYLKQLLVNSAFVTVQFYQSKDAFMDYAEISKETIGLLYKSRASLKKSPVSGDILSLVELRVSQINKCPYCCQLHTKEAQKLGIEQKKLDNLSTWRNSLAFTEEEKTVLQWVESVTLLDKNLKENKQHLNKIYSERQIVDLTACIAIMNAFNRIVISL